MPGTGLALPSVQYGHVLQALGQLRGVAQREQHANALDHFASTATGRGQHRHTGNHRFEQDHAERLVIGTQSKHVERLEVTARIRYLAKKVDLPGNAKLGSQRLEPGLQTPLAEDRQAGASR
ncbi:hypothetical protein D3C72_1416130 [compost metagenome]